MNRYIYFASLFFCFSSSFSQNSFEINTSISNASVVETQSIHIFNVDSDILLTGDFLIENNFDSIWLEPRNGYSITIKNSSILGRHGITDDVEERPAPRISIYPNPTSSTITINITTQEEITNLELYNNYGVRQTDPTLEVDNLVNLESYTNGVYLLKIHLNNGETLTKTIIKQ